MVDALAGASFLKGIGAGEVVVVGHSFGGAVAIKSGELSQLITGVVAISSQRFGTQTVEKLKKPENLARAFLFLLYLSYASVCSV